MDIKRIFEHTVQQAPEQSEALPQDQKVSLEGIASAPDELQSFQPNLAQGPQMQQPFELAQFAPQYLGIHETTLDPSAQLQELKQRMDSLETEKQGLGQEIRELDSQITATESENAGHIDASRDVKLILLKQQLAQVKDELAQVDFKIQQLMKEIQKLQDAEAQAQDKTGKTQESEQSVMDNTNKAAESYSDVLKATDLLD